MASSGRTVLHQQAAGSVTTVGIEQEDTPVGSVSGDPADTAALNEEDEGFGGRLLLDGSALLDQAEVALRAILSAFCIRLSGQFRQLRDSLVRDSAGKVRVPRVGRMHEDMVVTYDPRLSGRRASHRPVKEQWDFVRWQSSDGQDFSPKPKASRLFHNRRCMITMMCINYAVNARTVMIAAGRGCVFRLPRSAQGYQGFLLCDRTREMRLSTALKRQSARRIQRLIRATTRRCQASGSSK